MPGVNRLFLKWQFARVGIGNSDKIYNWNSTCKKLVAIPTFQVVILVDSKCTFRQLEFRSVATMVGNKNSGRRHRLSFYTIDSANVDRNRSRHNRKRTIAKRRVNVAETYVATMRSMMLLDLLDDPTVMISMHDSLLDCANYMIPRNLDAVKVRTWTLKHSTR